MYRARPYATRRSLTAATARLQSLRGSSTSPIPDCFWCDVTLLAAGERAPLERSCAVGNLVAGRELEHRYGQAADRELEACV